MFRYGQSYDKSISDELKERFGQEIEALERQGFRFFSLHQERIWPFSVILLFPIYMLMRSKEYVCVETPLRITSWHLMYVSEDGSTFAYFYGLGCKFYTKFVDGTWVVSNTAQSLQGEKVVIQKRDEEAVGTEQVWRKHQQKLKEVQLPGMQPATRVSFEDWVEIESRFDRSNLTSVMGLGLTWLLFLIWAIYWLIRNGVTILNAIY
jgi:hypothetical protein